jgi:hypothetical protein
LHPDLPTLAMIEVAFSGRNRRDRLARWRTRSDPR